MDMPCAQSELSFDLDFLLGPSNNNVETQIIHSPNQTENTSPASAPSDAVIQFSPIEQLQSSGGRNKKADVNYLKRKLVSTDLLVRTYHEKCSHVKTLEQILLDTNIKFREACIERDAVRQTCENLEQEFNKLRNQAQELETKLLEREQIHAATVSHTNQLQQLVKEYDVQVESVRAEKASSRATIKDLERKVAILTKCNEENTSHLCTVADIVASKRPLTHSEKFLMSKYLRLKRKRDAASGKNNPAKLKCDKDGDICEEFLSDTDGCPDINSEQIMSSPPLPPKIQTIQKSELNKEIQTTQKSELTKDDADGDPDLTIEITSVDTGRGSSLAFSDSDTLYSPEYYINSPPIMLKLKPKQTDASTSPLPWGKQLEDKSTSPIVTEVDTSHKNTAKALKTVDRALSPITFSAVLDKASSPVRFSTVSNIDGIEPLSTVSEHKTSGNNRHSESDNMIDDEVEMILNNMKLSGGLVTPIPPTPARSNGAKSRTRNDPIFPVGNNSWHSAFNNIVPVILGLGEAVKQLANNRKDVMVPNLNDMRAFFGIPEADAAYDETPEVIDDTELDVPCQNTSRVINSPEPDVLFEVTSIDEEKECVDSNEQPTKSNITPSIQIENEKDMQGVVPISPQMTSTKTNIKDKIQFENDKDDQPESITNQDKSDNSVVQEVNISCNGISKDMKKASKAKKLTRLGKLRKNLIPKSKIRDITPPRTLRSRTKAHLNTPINKINSNKATSSSKSIAPLNNMDVYEKAVRVMAELKSQNKTVKPKIIRKCKKKLADDIPMQTNVTLQKAVSTEQENIDLNTPGKCNDSVVTHETNISDDQSNRTNTPTSFEETPGRKVTEEPNHSKSVTNAPNVTVDTVETPKQNNTPTSVKKTPRRSMSISNETNVSVETSNQNNTSTSHLETPRRKMRIPEEFHHTKSMTNKANVSVDTLETSIKNNTFASVGKTQRRRSDTYEIDNIMAKTRKKYPSMSLDKDIVVVLARSELNEKYKIVEKDIEKTEEVPKPQTPSKIWGGLKRSNNDKLESAGNKRVLRSSVRSGLDAEQNNNERKISNKNSGNRALTPKPVSDSSFNKSDLGSSLPNIRSELINKPKSSNSLTSKPNSESATSHNDLISYNDLDIFNDDPTPPPPKKQKCVEVTTNTILSPQESVLCKMISIHGVNKIKIVPKKIPENTVNAVYLQITESIDHIIQLPPTETQDAMKKMTKEMQKWTFKEFLTGLMLYLTDPTRKLELLNKVNVPPAPPMTKAEQVLLYIVTRLTWDNIDTVDRVLSQIEYTLFRLNQTPEVKVVESMAHFYAVLCRYIKAKNRLRIFVLDAMYCLTYSAVALIKQCIDVWMHILPLAHMGTAKSPLVTCLVYLLHFFKCDDTQHKVQDIRNILKHKYFFHVTDWDETKILEMFKNAILELRDNAVERKMLQLALILLAKRSGVRWCQNKIVKSMLMPMITEEKVPERTKAFCISILGALFKPYPENMKVHCEIAVNQLTDMLDKKPSPVIEEAIYTSLILLSKHNTTRVVQALLAWQPEQLSPYMENMLTDYVKEKPVRVWRAILSNVSLVK